MTIFNFEHEGESYALDILTAYALTRVGKDGTGRDADLAELPVSDPRDALARQLAEGWAAKCMTKLVEPAELHLARHIVRAILPDPDGDEQAEADLDEVLRARWTRQGRAAA